MSGFKGKERGPPKSPPPSLKHINPIKTGAAFQSPFPGPPPPLLETMSILFCVILVTVSWAVLKVKREGLRSPPLPPVAGRTHNPVLNKLCNNGWVLFKIVLLPYLHYVCFWLSMQLKEIGPKFNLNSCVVEKWPKVTILRFLLVRIISCLSFRSSVRKDDWEINL